MPILSSISQLIRRYPVSAFVFFSCLLTWLLALPPHFGIGAQEWKETVIGAPISALGPVIAILVVVGLESGLSGIALFLSRATHFRCGWNWMAFVLLTPLMILGSAVLLSFIIGHDITAMHGQAPADMNWGYWVLVWLAPGLIFAFCEELGWRGFALDRLMRRYSCFTATALVAALWALWHLPFFVFHEQTSVAQVTGLASSLFAESVVLTYIYTSGRSGLFLAIIWHINWRVIILLASIKSTAIPELMNATLMLVATGLLFVIDRKGFAAPIGAQRY